MLNAKKKQKNKAGGDSNRIKGDTSDRWLSQTRLGILFALKDYELLTANSEPERGAGEAELTRKKNVCTSREKPPKTNTRAQKIATVSNVIGTGGREEGEGGEVEAGGGGHETENQEEV